MQTGGALTEALAFFSRTQKASLARSDMSLVLACVQGHLGVSVMAIQMRRLLGPRGAADRQSVLVAADMRALSGREAD